MDWFLYDRDLRHERVNEAIPKYQEFYSLNNSCIKITVFGILFPLFIYGTIFFYLLNFSQILHFVSPIGSIQPTRDAYINFEFYQSC